jgi:hypothetical protein
MIPEPVGVHGRRVLGWLRGHGRLVVGVLVDFAGTVRGSATGSLQAADVDEVTDHVESLTESLCTRLPGSLDLLRYVAGTTSFAVVTNGAGTGCALRVDGRILSGAHGVSGELGPVCAHRATFRRPETISREATVQG